MPSSRAGLPCLLMRGGTSKGAYFLAEDLPADPGERDDLLLRIMGSPDARQIDGIGGAHPLTSKVAVISPSVRPDADVDYLFLQVGVDQATVSDRPVLLRLESGGHLAGSLDQVIDETTDWHAFLFDQLGLCYRPVSRAA